LGLQRAGIDFVETDEHYLGLPLVFGWRVSHVDPREAGRGGQLGPLRRGLGGRRHHDDGVHLLGDEVLELAVLAADVVLREQVFFTRQDHQRGEMKKSHLVQRARWLAG
jgi:hypothetical protein